MHRRTDCTPHCTASVPIPPRKSFSFYCNPAVTAPFFSQVSGNFPVSPFLSRKNFCLRFFCLICPSDLHLIHIPHTFFPCISTQFPGYTGENFINISERFHRILRRICLPAVLPANTNLPTDVTSMPVQRFLWNDSLLPPRSVFSYILIRRISR